MTPIPKRIGLVVVVGLLPAALAALPPAFDPATGVRTVEWAAATVTAVLAASCLAASRQSVPSAGTRGRTRLVAALSLAVLAPAAADAASHPVWADISLVTAALAVLIGTSRTEPYAIGLSAALTFAACVCAGTALVWPAGCAVAAVSARPSRRPAATVAVFGAAGFLCARVAGWPTLWPCDLPGAGGLIHRDLTLLLPVLLVGGTGLVIGRPEVDGQSPRALDRCLVPWGGTAVCGLVLAVFGLPIDVRLCALALWWAMPDGLDALAEALDSKTRRAVLTRIVAVLSVALLAVLAWPGLARLRDGALLLFHIVSA